MLLSTEATLSTILPPSLSLIWVYAALLRGLKPMAIEMAHMEPMDILAEPYPSKDLMIFTLPPTIFCLAYHIWKHGSSKAAKILSTFFNKFIYVIVVCVMSGGNKMVADPEQSIIMASLVSALLLTTCDRNGNLALQLNRTNTVDFTRLYGMAVGCIVCSILLILDWGAQVQRWPLPLTLGTTYGYAVGSIIGIGLHHFQQK